MTNVEIKPIPKAKTAVIKSCSNRAVNIVNTGNIQTRKSPRTWKNCLQLNLFRKPIIIQIRISAD